MELTKVDSSNVNAIGYDDETEELYVEFHSGVTYKYLNVPYYVFEELRDASSVGKYLNSEVKNMYPYERL